MLFGLNKFPGQAYTLQMHNNCATLSFESINSEINKHLGSILKNWSIAHRALFWCKVNKKKKFKFYIFF